VSPLDVYGLLFAALTVGVGAGYCWREIEEWNARREARTRGTAGPEYSSEPWPHHYVEYPAGRKGDAP